MSFDLNLDPQVRLALGPQPLPDATHILPPLVVPPSDVLSASGPDAGVCFIVDVVAGTKSFPIGAGIVQATFGPSSGLRLGVVQKWGERKYRAGQWVPLETIAPDVGLTGIVLAWELASLLTEGTEATTELTGYATRARQGAESLGFVASPRETPASAAARAMHLIALKSRFAHAVEMRLLPGGRGFPSRQVWRAAYALGFEWNGGNFQWKGGTRRAQITLSPVGLPTQWLPDRAAEGEGTLGLALSFEIPPCPDPLGIYDRMANTLASLRQHLGGVPVTPDGGELDAERLWDNRDELAETVQTMTDLKLAPGSPAALRFF